MQEDFLNAADANNEHETSDLARPPPGYHRRNIVKAIEELAHRHDTWRVFSDFVEMSALSISYSVDCAQFAAREARYMEIVKRYSSDEVKQFAIMFAELIMGFRHRLTMCWAWYFSA